jgi:diguanylate cyclase (GGDEF)-like protein
MSLLGERDNSKTPSRKIKVKHQRHVVLYSILMTLFAMSLSLIVTVVFLNIFHPPALQLRFTYVLTLLVPAIVAPFISVFSLQLVLKLEQAKKQLETLSRTDALTNIYNRGFFWQRTEQELTLAKKQSSPVALILFDIDNFKTFNDTYGHAVGDQILKVCAETASKSIRANDYIARYGGEEFAVFLQTCSPQEAQEVSERIRLNIAAIDFPYNDLKLHITVSVGLVTTHKALPLETLAKTADQAMYQAKHQGKNCVMSLAV